jgi:NAD(P)-dependent dehydrogenase (short-subunit alcohol dehydrogenase family)
MGTGVSLAVARRFGREGYRIASIARRPDSLAAAEAALREAGIEARSFEGDAADEASLVRVLSAIRAQMGDPEVLVYNASAGTPGPPTSLSPNALQRDFAVNVVGAVVCARECAPAMTESGRGTIFLTGGGLALEPMAEIASLALGKAAIRSLAFSLAQELGPRGVHVATVTICGFVKEGTRFAPDLVAEEYWRLHTQSAGKWEREMIYK